MQVDEVMSSARSCRPEASVRDCARIMRDENIGFVPICDRDGRPIGTLTDRDVAIRVVAEGHTIDEKAERCMSKGVVACRTGDDVSFAHRLMRERQVSRVMVCDASGKLQGVVSLQDLAASEGEEATGRTVTEVKSDQPSAH